MENWELKVNAIKHLGHDFIFLSDLRLKRKDRFDITTKLRAALLRGAGNTSSGKILTKKVGVLPFWLQKI
jgi:hypothetical protein